MKVGGALQQNDCFGGFLLFTARRVAQLPPAAVVGSLAHPLGGRWLACLIRIHWSLLLFVRLRLFTVDTIQQK